MPAAIAPALGLATVAGLYCRRKVGRRTDRRCPLLFSRPRRMHVVSRERSVGAFEIRYLKLGIRGRAFAGCTFVKAVVPRAGQSWPHMPSMLQSMTYVQVFPGSQLLDTLADIFESTSGFLQKIIDSFPNAVCLPFRAQKIYLLTQSCDTGGKTEQLARSMSIRGSWRCRGW